MKKKKKTTFDHAYEVFRWLGLMGAIIWILSTLLCTPYDTTDDELNSERSGLRLHTDNLTGCQYLSTFLGGPTPRLDAEGKHVGCRGD